MKPPQLTLMPVEIVDSKDNMEKIEESLIYISLVTSHICCDQVKQCLLVTLFSVK